MNCGRHGARNQLGTNDVKASNPRPEIRIQASTRSTVFVTFPALSPSIPVHSRITCSGRYGLRSWVWGLKSAWKGQTHPGFWLIVSADFTTDMAMANEDTQRLIHQVEECTGYRVTVGTSSSISTDAEMISAAKTHPVHIINVASNSGEFADYITAVQCVMLLTMWTHPLGIPEFTPDNEKIPHVQRKAMNWKGLEKLPKSTAEMFASQIVIGLLHQLRSTPSELIAVEHIYKNCPQLRDQQAHILNRNLRQYTQSMKPEVRKLTPPNIFEGNQLMSGALAKLWCDLTGSKLPMLPYKSIGLESRITDFLNMYYTQDGTMAERILLTVDGWAEKLKLRTLYTWRFRSKDDE